MRATPTSTRSRLRFTLIALFLFISFVAIAAAAVAHWYHPYRQATAAQAAFDYTYASWEAGLASWPEVFESSKARMEAWLAVPLVNQESAVQNHRDLVDHLEQHLQQVCNMPNTGEDIMKHERHIVELQKHRQQLDNRLGESH